MARTLMPKSGVIMPYVVLNRDAAVVGVEKVDGRAGDVKLGTEPGGLGYVKAADVWAKGVVYQKSEVDALLVPTLKQNSAILLYNDGTTDYGLRSTNKDNTAYIDLIKAGKHTVVLKDELTGQDVTTTTENAVIVGDIDSGIEGIHFYSEGRTDIIYHDADTNQVRSAPLYSRRFRPEIADMPFAAIGTYVRDSLGRVTGVDKAAGINSDIKQLNGLDSIGQTTDTTALIINKKTHFPKSLVTVDAEIQGNVTVAGTTSHSDDVNMNSHLIKNLADPTLPTDAANAKYVQDNFVAKQGNAAIEGNFVSLHTGSASDTGIQSGGHITSMYNVPGAGTVEGVIYANALVGDPEAAVTLNVKNINGHNNDYSFRSDGQVFGVKTLLGNVAVGSLLTCTGLQCNDNAQIVGNLAASGNISGTGLTTSSHVSVGGAVQFGGGHGTTMNSTVSSTAATVNLASYTGATRFSVTGGYVTRKGSNGNFGAGGTGNLFNFNWGESTKPGGHATTDLGGSDNHSHYIQTSGPALDSWIDDTLVGRIAFAYTSDKELKKDIKYRSDINKALDEVNQWKPVDYTYKAYGVMPEVKGKFGFIANDLVKVSPETVKGAGLKEGADIEDNDVRKNAYELDAVAMIAKLTQAVQALTKRVEELEAKQ